MTILCVSTVLHYERGVINIFTLKLLVISSYLLKVYFYASQEEC